MPFVLMTGDTVLAELSAMMPGALELDAADPRMTVYNARPPSLADFSAALRDAKISAGITVGGNSVKTDAGSQVLLEGAFNLAQINANTVGWVMPFETATGAQMALTAAQVIGLAEAAGAYVQSCFSAHASILSQIASAAITTTAQIEAAYAGVKASF